MRAFVSTGIQWINHFCFKLFEFFQDSTASLIYFRDFPFVANYPENPVLTGETGKEHPPKQESLSYSEIFLSCGGYNNRTKLILLRTSKTFFETDKKFYSCSSEL